MTHTLRPIGWICGEMVRKFAGQAEILQRAFLEIVDEIRDEFPNLLRLTSSNQGKPEKEMLLKHPWVKKRRLIIINMESTGRPNMRFIDSKEAIALCLQDMSKPRDRPVKESGSVMARVFSSAHGAIIMNGLTKISHSSKSVAKFLQPRLAKKLAELNMVSHNFFNTLKTPKQPLYRVKKSTMFFYDTISYPARTALTSVMCASYAALICLAFSLTKILGKIRNLVRTDKASSESSSDGVNADGFSRVNETASDFATTPTQEGSSQFVHKTSKNDGSIHTLLLAMDQENEQ